MRRIGAERVSGRGLQAALDSVIRTWSPGCTGLGDQDVVSSGGRGDQDVVSSGGRGDQDVVSSGERGDQDVVSGRPGRGLQ